MGTYKEDIKGFNKHLNLFSLILAFIWLVSGVIAGRKIGLKYGLLVWLIGLAFILLLRFLQGYFSKMLINYEENLKKAKGDD